MGNITMQLTMQRRRAEVTITKYWSMKFDIPIGVTTCYVLGLYQDISEDGGAPIFVCELDSGNVIMVSPELVKFIDTEGGIIKC